MGVCVWVIPPDARHVEHQGPRNRARGRLNARAFKPAEEQGREGARIHQTGAEGGARSARLEGIAQAHTWQRQRPCPLPLHYPPAPPHCNSSHGQPYAS